MQLTMKIPASAVVQQFVPGREGEYALRIEYFNSSGRKVTARKIETPGSRSITGFYRNRGQLVIYYEG